jgi:hypothetical protein
MSNSLYDRLGGHDASTAIAIAFFGNHCKNEQIKTRYPDNGPEHIIRESNEIQV